MDSTAKLDALRRLLAQEGLGYCILTTSDDHLTESPGAHWRTIQWLCRFSGSFATLVIGPDSLALWTDGRYLVQAERQVDLPGAQIFDVSNPQHPAPAAWLLAQMARRPEAGCRVAYDSRCFSHAQARQLKAACTPHGADGAVVFCHAAHLLDALWVDRPAQPRGPLFALSDALAGQSCPDKLHAVRQQMAARGAQYYLLSALDDIAWLTNLRGRDYPVHPLFPAYMLLSAQSAWLFTDSPVDRGLAQGLSASGITLLPEAQAAAMLGKLEPEARLCCDPGRVTHYLADALPPTLALDEGPDIVRWMKAEKNPGEIANLRAANIDEGVALCRMLMALEETPLGTLDEVDVGQMLEAERRSSPDYVMAGNIPIVGYMANAALPHYRPDKGNTVPLQPQGMLLFDVVAHYRTGSTDISRTLALGPVSHDMRRDYTIVLKALIALASQLFPAYATGAALDSAARNVLWRYGRDYQHGTGHGIGYCLTVHEGPQTLGPAWYKKSDLFCDMALRPGMVVSNEPGIYHVGQYGIRLENNVVVTPHESGFFCLETLTLCPFDRALIVPDMLSEAERTWLNAYHARVLEALSPRLNAAEQAWLAGKTQAL